MMRYTGTTVPRQIAPLPDTQLVMGRDRATSFAALFREHQPAVWRFVARRAWPDAVDDVVADTFLVAWRRFDDVPADALPWLYGTATKVLANHRRAALRGDALIARLRAEPHGGDHDEHAARAHREAIVQALAQLSERERALVLLIEWEQLSAARAARVLGVSAAGASARVYRARKKLRRALAAALAEPVASTYVRRTDEVT
jgi:RNA polymerase sigma-70 factor, ECF subfamily